MTSTFRTFTPEFLGPQKNIQLCIASATPQGFSNFSFVQNAARVNIFAVENARFSQMN